MPPWRPVHPQNAQRQSLSTRKPHIIDGSFIGGTSNVALLGARVSEPPQASQQEASKEVENYFEMHVHYSAML